MAAKFVYFKDNLNGACRRLDENVPKNAIKIRAIEQAMKYRPTKSGKLEPSGARWEKITKTEFDKWVKLTKEG